MPEIPAVSPWRTWRRQRWVFTGLVAALATAVAWALVLSEAAPSSPATVTPQTVRAGMTLAERPCAIGATGPFTPTSFEIPGVLGPVPVLALPRDSRGVPDVAPLTEAGKHEVVWDKAPVGIMPGSAQGNALFNAHTWPWSQAPALGNIMLKGLQPGGTIVLKGQGVTQCYRVTKQVVAPANGPYVGFYDTTGPPQIAIIVCSGVRAGPGDWLERTIWFASPYTSGTPAV